MSTFFFTSYQTYHIDLINTKVVEKIEKVREIQRMMLRCTTVMKKIKINTKCKHHTHSTHTYTMTHTLYHSPQKVNVSD